ncbi:MAG TPA: pyridoxamine 5'-phosphate oxidase [Ignavibacteriaceae bacterium]|nr:pyridoxamine 5'-phosphate oxidase [Ignavibacteriaceae bacterium]
MINNTDLSSLRRNYSLQRFDESTVEVNPFQQFSKWMEEALKSDLLDPTGMALGTANKDGIPAVRMVLLKGFDENGFVFFTNYESHKGSDLVNNPNASILFFWKELERQIRITGTIEKTTRQESEEYFHTRPLESQLSAWASRQSSPIPNRKFLENEFDELKLKYGHKQIPLPPFWGGFRLIPNYFEFWQGRENRLHDRISYKIKNEFWDIIRLSP